MTIRFWISSSILEIFAAKLGSRPRSGQILHVFRPRNFSGVRPPKFWTSIIKFGLVLTIVQNFAPFGPRISEISCWIKKTSCVKHKSFRKLSFSGGLIMLAFLICNLQARKNRSTCSHVLTTIQCVHFATGRPEELSVNELKQAQTYDDFIICLLATNTLKPKIDKCSWQSPLSFREIYNTIQQKSITKMHIEYSILYKIGESNRNA